MTDRVARGALVGAVAGMLLLTGCGSGGHAKVEPTAAVTPSSGASSPGAALGSPRPSAVKPDPASSSAGKPSVPRTTSAAGQSVVSGTITEVKDMTARLSSPRGTVTIFWDSGTAIVDAVEAKPADVVAGSCVLVLPPTDGPPPTATAMTAAVVRLIPSSPSCPVVPGTSPAAGSKPTAGAGGTITLVGGPGVIGTVTDKSAKGFTLRSRGDVKVRVIAVATNRQTEYRKAGDHPRAAVDVGRCATVWGKRTGARVDATRIRTSDAVGGACPAEGVS